jgi:hypothetical protein
MQKVGSFNDKQTIHSLSTMTYMRNLKITYAKAPTSLHLKEIEGLRIWEYYKCGHFEPQLR